MERRKKAASGVTGSAPSQPVGTVHVVDPSPIN